MKQVYNNLCQVLVCGYDGYQEVWNPMFYFLNKYWKDCPFQVNLMSNTLRYKKYKVRTLLTGAKVDWSTGFKTVLTQIESPYVFVIMEDYFLTEKVDTKGLLSMLDFMKKNTLGCLRTYPCPTAKKEEAIIDHYPVGKIDKRDRYRVSLQAALWDREFLIKLIKEGDSAWQFEHEGSKRSMKSESEIYSVCKNDKIAFNYLCTAVTQGYYIKEAVQLCQKEGIELKPVKITIEPMIHRMYRVYSDQIFGVIKKTVKKTRFYDIYRQKKYK